MTATFSVYFAGPLFNHKDLTGNRLLADAIGRVSTGVYACVVPQDLEQTETRAVDIRNQDLTQLLECDMALFNFDGAELDSGTVVEFVYAKLLDIPSVIFRSDIHGGGDQTEKEGDPWNLMASFYPRTSRLLINGMEWYQQSMTENDSEDAARDALYQRMATSIIEHLDKARAEMPIAPKTTSELVRLYDWALRFPGGGLNEHGDATDRIESIISAKRGKGVLPPE